MARNNFVPLRNMWSLDWQYGRKIYTNNLPIVPKLYTLHLDRIQGFSATPVSGHLPGSRNKKQTFILSPRWLLTFYLERPWILPERRVLSSLKARRSLLDISSGYLSLFPRRCVIVEAVWRPKRSRGPPLWQLVATYTKTPWLLYLVRKMIIFMGLEVNKHAGIWDHHPLVCS